MNGKKEGALTQEQLIEIRKIFKKTFGPGTDIRKLSGFLKMTLADGHPIASLLSVHIQSNH